MHRTASDSTGVPSAPSSLEVRVVAEDAPVRIGYPDDDGGTNVTHYSTKLEQSFTRSFLDYIERCSHSRRGRRLLPRSQRVL